MSLFLLQPRVLKSASDEKHLSFPASVTAKITFVPEDAFGVTTMSQRTTIPLGNVGGKFSWDFNEDVTWFEGELIRALEAKFAVGRVNAELTGNYLALIFQAESFEQLSMFLASANQFLPALLSFHLGTFIWIKLFEVDVEGNALLFHATRSSFPFHVTTAERNSKRVVKSVNEWLAMAGGSDIDCRRLLTAFHYYRHARRFDALQPDRQAGVAEVILNLTKALEIIFSSNRDQLRIKAIEWGFDKSFIEEKIIPLFLLRNQMDVAHVATGPLSPDQKQIILRFVANAMSNIHCVLERITELVMLGEIELDPISGSLDRDKEKLLQAIEQYSAQEIGDGVSDEQRIL